MAYLKNWTDNFFQIFFMGTSWVAVSINNIKTRASSEMTSRKNIKNFDFNGVNVFFIYIYIYVIQVVTRGFTLFFYVVLRG